MEERLIRRPEVMRLVGLKRSWIDTLIKDGRFPAPVRLGERIKAWRLSEVQEWIKSLPTAKSEDRP